MFPFSSKIAAVIPLSLLFPTVALAQEAEPAPEEVPAEEVPDEAPEEAPTQDPPPADEALEAQGAEPPAAETAPEPEPEPAPEPVVEEPLPEEGAPPEELAPQEPPVEEPAPSPLPLSVGISTWSRFEYRQNYDKIGVSRTRFQEGDATFFRARMSFKTNPLPLGGGMTGQMVFDPQATGQWGTQGGGGTIGEAALGMYQGYIQLASDAFAFKLGRFEMKYGEALIIGNLDWHQSGRAFDGAHLSLTPGKVSIDAFVTQTAEGYPANQPFMVGDQLFWGVYGQFGGAISEGMGLDVYALARTWGANDFSYDDDGDATTPNATTHTNNATMLTLGARAKQSLGIFDYRLEAGVQLGKTRVENEAANLYVIRDKMAYQADLEFGVSPAKGFRISVNGAIASGDSDGSDDTDRTWDELYPTTHKWLGLMDVIGFRRNVATVNAKVSANLTQSTIFKLDAHYFSRLEKAYALGMQADSHSYTAGYEFDTQVVQKLGKFAYARALYGIFLPNKDHYGTNVAVHYLAAQGGLKF